MLKFHVSVHGGVATATKTLSVTFEEAFSALERLDRLFIEPDGSFVWTGVGPLGESWQFDGNLIDQGNCLAYVELKGRCPGEQLDLLLVALGWPAANLAFQLTQRGVFVSEPEFRQLAETEKGAI